MKCGGFHFSSPELKKQGKKKSSIAKAKESGPGLGNTDWLLIVFLLLSTDVHQFPFVYVLSMATFVL